MRGQFVFAIAMGLAFTALSAHSAQAQNKEPLRWGADAEGGVPYIFPDPKDPTKFIGFEVELKEALEKELGRKIIFKQYEYEKLLDGLEQGDFDFAMNGLEITEDRKERVLFSRPYFFFKLQLAVRKD